MSINISKAHYEKIYRIFTFNPVRRHGVFSRRKIESDPTTFLSNVVMRKVFERRLHRQFPDRFQQHHHLKAI
jgi:hypothetical protein